MPLHGSLHLGSLTRCEVVRRGTSVWVEVVERDEVNGFPIMAGSARYFEQLADAATDAANLLRGREENAPGPEADRQTDRVGACDDRARGLVP